MINDCLSMKAVITAVALVTAGFTPVATNAADLKCTPFEIISKSWKRGVHPEGEPVIGMKRAGTRRLHSESGEELGLYTYAGTVVEVLEDGGTIMNFTRTWTFKEGTIAGVGMIAHPDAVNVQAQPDQVVSVVTGGTGAFRGVHGSIEMSEPVSEGNRLVRFDIACD